jgi:lipopolysaccharide/colanic/teichoic acid biosynthesis glycosyltransferase
MIGSLMKVRDRQQEAPRQRISALRQASRWTLSRTQHRRPLQLDVLPESRFLSALCVERKRAERSSRPFVLMLLDQVPASGDVAGDDDLFEKGAPAVVSAIRKTDVPGWYADNRVFGVIFSELGTADNQAALVALRERVTAALQSTLGPDQMQRLRITFDLFPDHPRDNGNHAERCPSPPPASLYPDLTERDHARKMSNAVKRTIDILGSTLALILLMPLFLVIAAAIKLTSPGPVLFRQKRIGQYGVPFTLLKFRSMLSHNDARQHQEFVTQFIGGGTPTESNGKNGQVVYKITDDPRVTQVGRLLRRTSLDELPQLFNVLRGEMSLVGPRPPVTYEVEAYQPWHWRRVLEAKPGITGLWQVSGRSRLRFDDMVRLDLQYAEQSSIWLDVKILVRTPGAVLSGDGAY